MAGLHSIFFELTWYVLPYIAQTGTPNSVNLCDLHLYNMPYAFHLLRFLSLTLSLPRS